jgi:multidrug efflux pump subunit AcrA (membrane-fusion protein)
MQARSPAAHVLATAMLLTTGVSCDSVGRASGGTSTESAPAPSGPRAVTALGRLQPKDGIIRVAGPSRPTVVIAKLLVDTGDVVEAGQPLAILDRNRCPYALMSLLNKVGAQTSDARDERALQVFAASIGVILDTWNETGKARRLRPAIAS